MSQVSTFNRYNHTLEHLQKSATRNLIKESYLYTQFNLLHNKTDTSLTPMSEQHRRGAQNADAPPMLPDLVCTRMQNDGNSNDFTSEN